MDFYFTDRQFKPIGLATTAGRDGTIAIDTTGDTESVSVASRTLTGTLHFTKETSALVQAMAPEGNFILYQDKLGRNVLMEVMEFTHDPLNGEHTFSAQDAGVDLIDETVDAYTADKAYDIAYYIDKFTWDSGWEIGINEISNLTRTLTFDSSDETALARIISVAKQFDGAEIAFSFERDDQGVPHKKIDIYKQRGSVKNVTLYVGKNINNIVTSGNIYDLCTSIKATGGTPDGKDTPINLKGYTWTDPDGRYVLGSDGILRDTVAVQSWSRLLTEGKTATSSHIQRVKTYEATTQATLLQSVLADLKQYNHPTRTYEADIVVMPEGLQVGDTVHLSDHDEADYLQTRLLSITTDHSTGTATCTLGDFVVEESQVSDSLLALANTLKAIKPVQYYPWTMYADDDQGTGMTSTPDGKKYMATIWGTTEEPSTSIAEYTGKWQRVTGNDGADGEAGPVGADGKTSYFHTAWADSLDGKTGFTVTGGDGKSYIGTYSDFTKADSTDPTAYDWALFKGANGVKGDPGADGAPGAKGADGKSSYLHTAYAQSADGKTGFSTTNAAGATYLGTLVDETVADSTDPTKYTWQSVQGPAGKDGDTGTPGAKGADGQTSYVHRAWADSADGKTNFSLTDSTNRGYLGIYDDFTAADSTDSSKYTWTELVGGLEIGGTNLLLDSGDFSTWSKGGVGSITKDNPATFDYPSTTIASGKTDDFLSCKISGLLPNSDYAFSFTAHGAGKLSTYIYPTLTASYYTNLASVPVTTQSDTQAIWSLTTTDTRYWLILHTLATVPATVTVLFRSNGTGGWGANTLEAHVSRPQLETGTKATAWSPNPKDQQKYTDTVVNAVQVGGRNYLLNSDFSLGLTGWGNSSWAVSADKYGGCGVITITPTAAWTGGSTNGIWQGIDALKGQTIMLSVWAKANKTGAKMHSEPYGGTNAQNWTLTTSWAKYSYVTTVSAVNDSVYWMAVDVGTTYSITQPKAELGTKATDWTPAPEDTKSAIAAIVPAPQSGTAFPAGPVKNQQFWLLNASTNAASLYQYDGSAWQPVKQDAAMLTATTFNGMTFNGVTFNGSQFQTSNTSSALLGDLDSLSGMHGGDTVTVNSTQTLDSSGYKNVAAFTTPVFNAPETITSAIDNSGRYSINQQIGTDGKNYLTLALNPAVGGISLEAAGYFGDASSNTRFGYLTVNDLIGLNNAGTVLWTGLIYPDSGQTVTPSIPLSQCLNGWILIYTWYASGAASNQSINIVVVPKAYGQNYSGAGLAHDMISSTGNTKGSKYVYITDTQIKGNDFNKQGNSAHFVLRMVVAF